MRRCSRAFLWPAAVLATVAVALLVAACSGETDSGSKTGSEVPAAQTSGAADKNTFQQGKPTIMNKQEAAATVSAQTAGGQATVGQTADGQTTGGQTQTAVFGAGCFWCVEAAFELLDGVLQVQSGYMGGSVANPTYEQICTGRTGHAEVVRVTFDPSRISFSELAAWFFQLHDPTTLNRQGADVGTQYRSVIFTADKAQHEQALAAKAAAAAGYADPIVTQIEPAQAFYPAEGYHQDFYRNNPSQPYCRMVIAPKLQYLKSLTGQ